MFLVNLLRKLTANNAAVKGRFACPVLSISFTLCLVLLGPAWSNLFSMCCRNIQYWSLQHFSPSLVSLQSLQRIPRSDRSTLSHAKTRTLRIVSTKGNALWLKPWQDPTNTAGKSPAKNYQKGLLPEGGSIRKKKKLTFRWRILESNGIFFLLSNCIPHIWWVFLLVYDNFIWKYVNTRSYILIFS